MGLGFHVGLTLSYPKASKFEWIERGGFGAKERTSNDSDLM